MADERRLNELLKAFIQESPEYRNVTMPESLNGRRDMLRSLMNVRKPGPLSPEVSRIQNMYLRERSQEKMPVRPQEMPSVKEDFGAEIPYGEKISVWKGDITRIAADAVVNAANNQMLGCFIPMHSCIDNQIHTYAGTELRLECAEIMENYRRIYGRDYVQPTGKPIITGGYNLPCKHVIHVAGPIVGGKLQKSDEYLLADCYRNVLDLCLENNLRSVAFCCISTGVFHFPNQRAAEIAVETVMNWIEKHPHGIDKVIFNVFKDEDNEIYIKTLKDLER
ncbi:MAG: protein-ADP-ribose hydrolase [Clostridiales bacterium]|nr:protein-ADP-ribose hydrolase [Clostridiales bacterium]